MTLRELIDCIEIQGKVHTKLIDSDGDIISLRIFDDFEYSDISDIDYLYVKHMYNACDCLQIELSESR